MKYKIGDKVKYDGGDWWFYATVSAVFEHPICPCYRLNVERMEKKSCKFSITQFEFEIELDNDVESIKDKRKWENSEIDYLKKYYGILNNEDLSKMLKRSPHTIEEKWRMTKQESEPEPEKKPKKERELKQDHEDEIVDSSQKPEIEAPKLKRGEAWDRNLEMHRKGVKSNIINAWIAQNRKMYNLGKLSEDKLEKLIEINFSFETVRKKKTMIGKSI